MGPQQARRRLLRPSGRRSPRARRGRLALLIPGLLGGCAGDAAREADRAYTAGLAQVEQIEVALVSTRPPRLRIDVRGVVSDACTEIDPPRIQTLGARIEISLETRRASGASCPPEPTPFTRSIPVMPGGGFRLYVVDVNGVSESVMLPPDREILEGEPRGRGGR